ncbi:uncharacterized protein EI90DRAFT_3035084 [Cantharellus anzutake]|uniref:uncharacterized protein n=1 Tax=Cantharellus anzutake TaxID=1750568 RepID=UPI001907E9A9|nr:uncharacterized protein EI90DRAFT_3035084 [Cantharellus anzutake]KAF8340287.1 hypothetical protein EI90DRAFT_3035084 [Cantharellus anzutake]
MHSAKDEEDEWDLNPTITYRHLLSNIPHVYNPLRVVTLCDNDAFYAACERIRLGLPPETPVAALQWDSLIAVSYPARTYGVKRMDNVKEAKKKCPNLVAVHVMTYKEGDSEPAYHDNPDPRHYKVSLDHYRRESKRIVDVYRERLPPGAELEKASIDECFFCLTLPVRDILLERYPYLGQVPPEAPNGLDTPLPPPPLTYPFEGLGNLIPIVPSSPTSPTDSKPECSIVNPSNSPRKGQPELPEVMRNESNASTSKHPVTWHDIALGIGAEIMLKMRTEVKEKLGYTTSCGIARNKPLAKLVASYKKLDQQSILRNAAIPGYWRPMPFQNIRFLGGKLGRTLSDDMDAETVGDLEHISLNEMQRMYGEESIWVWQVLRGIDRSEEYASSKNIQPAFTDPDEGEQWIRLLSSELAIRLADAREVTPTIWPKTIAVHFSQGSERRASKQSPFPYTRNLTATYVGNVALKLWEALTKDKKEKSGSGKIHNIGVSFGGLMAAETGQRSIKGFLAAPRPRRDGSPLVAFLKLEPTEGQDRLKRRPRDQSSPELQEAADSSDSNSFVCSRCSRRISLPSDSREGLDDRDAMASLKMEHEDFHFAQDLAREDHDLSPSRTSMASREVYPDRPSTKKPRKESHSAGGRKAAKDGIAKYFSPGPPTPSSSSKALR